MMAWLRKLLLVASYVAFHGLAFAAIFVAMFGLKRLGIDPEDTRDSIGGIVSTWTGLLAFATMMIAWGVGGFFLTEFWNWEEGWGSRRRFKKKRNAPPGPTIRYSYSLPSEQEPMMTTAPPR